MFEKIKNILGYDTDKIEKEEMIILLDPGHGGMSPGPYGSDSLYLTAGKQSSYVPPGIYEGEFNEDICNRVKAGLADRGIRSVILRQGPVNTKLGTRIKYANQLHKKMKNCIYLSIHANAQRLTKGRKWGGAEGSVVFCHPNGKKSNIFAKHLERCLSNYSNSRGIKHSRWYGVCRKTTMPAALVECEFMTNIHWAEYMASEQGRANIAFEIISAISAFHQDS